MKKQILFLMLIASLCYARQGLAQQEFEAGLRIQLQAPITQWLQFGQGAGAVVWATFPVSRNGNVVLSAGCQHYGGYQAGLINIEETTSPFEYWRNTEIVQLNGVTFGAVDLGYEYKWLGSKWSTKVGIQLSQLLRTEGFHSHYTLYHSRKIRSSTQPSYPLDIGLSGVGESRFLEQTSEPVSEDYLNTSDLALYIALEYQLTKGLAAECGLYQGLLNRWNPDNIELHPLRISSLYLGLSVRIF